MKNKLIYNIILFLSVFLALILFISNVGFIFHQSINYLYVFLSFFLSAGLVYYVTKSAKTTFFTVIGSLIIILISYLIAIYNFDFSYDGQAYHQETIYLISKGWNPLYEPSGAFRKLFVAHYQKGLEIIQADIYCFTNKIESVKLITYIIDFIGFVAIYKFFRNYDLGKKKSFLFSVLVLSNPVVIGQLFKNYVDQNWFILLTIIIASVLSYTKTDERKYLIVFVASSLIFSGIKFSSIPVYVVVIGGIGIGLFFRNKMILKKLILPLIIIISAIIICNINPFVTNFQSEGNPFYPLMGKNKIDIINKNMPEVLKNHNRAERLMISLFSKTTGDRTINNIDKALKIPFTFSKEETGNNGDMRLGGFGFLFSGIFLISVFFLLFLLYENRKDKKLLITFSFSLLVLFLTIIINPADWYARLCPQIWLFPIVILFFNEILSQKSKILSRIIIVLLLVNSIFPNLFLVLGIQMKKNMMMNQLIDSVGENTIYIDNGGFRQFHLRFEERNIKYKLQKLGKNERTEVPYSEGIYYKIAP